MLQRQGGAGRGVRAARGVGKWTEEVTEGDR